MANSRRKFSNIISLVHFDYPYFNEPDDGCRDEINGNIYTRKGNVEFTTSGQEKAPADSFTPGTPKFGYRCLKTSGNSDYITAVNHESRFNFSRTGSYEFECFIMAMSVNSGNIIAFRTDDNIVLGIVKNSENKIAFTSSELAMNITSSSSINLNEWTHIKCVLKNGTAKIYINASESGSGFYTQKSFVPDELTIGGLYR